MNTKEFTKAYIKECDCKKIQILHLHLNPGDWITYKNCDCDDIDLEI